VNVELLYALDGKERKEIINLLEKAFSGKVSSSFFDLFLKNTPYKKYIVVKDESICVGVLCLLDRHIYVNSIAVATTAISYMAVDVNYRNFKVTNLIKARLFDYLQGNSLLSLGIARKALDGYWSPYGYVGATNFSEIFVDNLTIPNSLNRYEVVNCERESLARLSELYHSTYGNISGGIVRDKNIWQHYFSKIENVTVILKCIMSNSNVVGYFLYENNRVLEVSGVLGLLKDLLKVIHHFIARSNDGSDEVIYEVGLSHPMVKWIRKYNHQINQRFVWNGGHIIRIESNIRLLELLRPELESRLNSLGYKNFEIEISNLNFCYKNDILKLKEIENKLDTLTSAEWVQLIFGIVNPEEIDSINLEEKHFLSLIFNKSHFQVPYLDQL